MRRICFAIIALLPIFHIVSYAGKKDSTDIKRVIENQILLVQQFDSLHKITDIPEKRTYNQHIVQNILNTLNIPASFNMSFDTIRPFGKITSDDELVCLYTYNVSVEFGEEEYFGFLQVYDKENDSILVYQLNDKSKEITNPETQKLYTHNWYGALYYKILVEKYKGETHYLILGFDFNNILTSKKIIETLKFNELGFPQFGIPIIKYQNKTYYRLLFEYNARANMVLTYNTRLKMVTFDHLSPYKPSLAGNYQFYGPDLSYDGLKFEKGYWILQENIDARNPN